MTAEAGRETKSPPPRPSPAEPEEGVEPSPTRKHGSETGAAIGAVLEGEGWSTAKALPDGRGSVCLPSAACFLHRP